MSEEPDKNERDWPLLAAAAFLLITSAVKGRLDGLSDPLVASMMSGGLICFGAWIVMEVRK